MIGHKILDYCWVCGERFIDKGGTAPRHHHHIIPQAYGGRDGAQVSICNKHHDKLHAMAELLWAGKPDIQYIRGEPAEAVVKLRWLATRAYNARVVYSKDPNKLVHVSLELNANVRSQIDKLKHVYPKARSREAIVLIAIDQLFKRHFT